MRLSKSTSTAVAAMVALNAGSASAATASHCASSGICFQWGVPEASAKAGSGNVYFQLKAPTSRQWVGLGIGSHMLDSDMFIMYQDGKGNVTLSTRPGTNHVMPTYQARSDVALLAGSGVVGDNMIANVRCGGCSKLDLSGNSSWIAAWKSGDPLDSTSPSEIIASHDDDDDASQFRVNLASASISSDSNPFLGSDDSSSDGGSGGAVSSGGSSGSSTNTLIAAHGILMSVIFVCLYPIGSMLMPLLGKWYLHASWQALAFLGMWAGFALGLAAANRETIFFHQCHTCMGVIVVALLSLQPIFGLIHHINYVKTQSRGVFRHMHIWYGRGLMILGVIDGGLGLQLAGAANRFVIVYSAVVGVMTVLYLSSIVVGLRRSRSKQVKQDESPVTQGAS